MFLVPESGMVKQRVRIAFKEYLTKVARKPVLKKLKLSSLVASISLVSSTTTALRRRGSTNYTYTLLNRAKHMHAGDIISPFFLVPTFHNISA